MYRVRRGLDSVLFLFGRLKRLALLVILSASLSANQYDYLLFSPVFSDVESGLKLEADVNARIEGITPLYQAVAKGQVEIVSALLIMGADVNAIVNGESALHRAVRSRDLVMTSLLLKAGAQVNIQDEKYGNTPLHYAAFDSNSICINLLTSSGADPYVKNHRGSSPSALILSETIIPPLVMEDYDLAISSSGFRLGGGGLALSLRNLTNRPLRIVGMQVFVNGKVVGSHRRALLIPPSTTINGATTIAISPRSDASVSVEDGLASVEVALRFDYQTEDGQAVLFDKKDFYFQLWRPPAKEATSK